jgi:hypothetical protein
MSKYLFTPIIILTICLVAPISISGQTWSINGDYAEGCSCNPACPCNFGSAPTLGYCEGMGLLEIKEGHYGDVNLDGISVVQAFSVGKWVKLYVSDNATDKQLKAAVKLIKLKSLFGPYFPEDTFVSWEKAPVTVERTATNIKFSVPTSTADFELMKGRDGNPIKIQNLVVPFYEDYTQYKTLTLDHSSSDKEFSHSGTSGQAGIIIASSDK